MLAQRLVWLTNRLLSHALGGFGVFCLIYSFILPKFGGEAFLFLSSATVLTYMGNRTD